MRKITLEDQRIIAIFNELLPERDPVSDLTYIESLLHKKRNSESEEFYIPVLGIQGTGKSSLLNALLMEDYILPVDADETTSVPAEIRFGESEKIVVHFMDKPPEELKNPKEIEQYVHNNYNPGNEKKVEMVQVYKNHALLKTGVVFVDLPGVGSLTESNIRTTMEYVEKLSAAIFMLRTVPPITRSEATFLKNVWPKLATSWFVQNQWHDESQSEVEDGKQHNKDILEGISDSYQMTEQIDIRVVNVYAALTGKLTNDQTLIEQSGIPAFEEFITSISSNWQSMLTEELKTLEEKAVKDIYTVLTNKIALYSKKPEEHYDYLREQEQLLQEKMDENSTLLQELKSTLVLEESKLKRWIHDTVNMYKGNLRVKMQKLIKANVVDGSRLKDAFNDNQEDISNEVVSEFIENITELKVLVGNTYQGLNVRTPDGTFDSFENFDKEEKLKLEKGLPRVTSIGVGVGVLLLSANPFALATIGVGMLASIAGGFISGKAKGMIQEKRMRTTIEELEEPINSFTANLEATLIDELSNFITHVNQTITKVNKEQELMLEQAYEEQRKIRFVEIDDYHAKKATLEEDLAYISLLEV